MQWDDAHVFRSANGLGQSALVSRGEARLFAPKHLAHLGHETSQQVGILTLCERIETELVEGVVPAGLGRTGTNGLSLYWRRGGFESGIVSELLRSYMLWESMGDGGGTTEGNGDTVASTKRFHGRVSRTYEAGSERERS